MRKSIVVLVVVLLVFASIYWFIPGKINIHQKLIVPVNTKAFARQILNEQTWNQWWPGSRNESSTSFEYNGNTYSLGEKKMTSLIIKVNKGNDSVVTELYFLPIEHDSIELSWNGIKTSPLNPVDRVKKLSWIKNLNSDFNLLLNKIKLFYSNENNLYGFHIEKSLVPDSNLVSTLAITKSYPSTQTIYDLTERLKDYISKNGAKEMGYAMLNISRNADSTFLLRVAIPTDKKLNDAGDIQYRWMLQGGNILITEVKGGPYQIERAFIEMANYVEDHQRIAPAIPFQSLITDRRKETDTNKWVTKIYWPVM